MCTYIHRMSVFNHFGSSLWCYLHPPLFALPRSHQCTMDSGRNKRFRSTVHKVDESRLFTNLAMHHADCEGQTSWAWGGSHFGKPNKACGADHGLLAKSSPILKHLITEAENGFPDARGVSRVLQSMHMRHGIFNGYDLLPG